MQIDTPERGFSYKTDGPLDLRLNPDKGESAAERLMQLEEAEIEGMLVENADEPYAAELATAIVMERKKGNTIDTTKKLYRIIEDTIQNVVKKEKGCKDQSEDVKMIIKKTAQRTFQAIRIDVNSEFEVLDAFLEKLPGVLMRWAVKS